MIGTTLSTCMSLRVLRVNLDFHDDNAHDKYPINRKKLPPCDESARKLAEKLLTLEKIALFYPETSNSSYGIWSTYSIDRTNPGHVMLSCIDRLVSICVHPCPCSASALSDFPVHVVDVHQKS